MNKYNTSLDDFVHDVQKNQRLEYLRGEIQAERISMSEVLELHSLAQYIESGDVLLLEWAGVPEHVEAPRRGDWVDDNSDITY